MQSSICHIVKYESRASVYVRFFEARACKTKYVRVRSVLSSHRHSHLNHELDPKLNLNLLRQGKQSQAATRMPRAKSP